VYGRSKYNASRLECEIIKKWFFFSLNIQFVVIDFQYVDPELNQISFLFCGLG